MLYFAKKILSRDISKTTRVYVNPKVLGFDNLLINLLYSIWNKDQGWQYRNFEKDRDVENTLF